MKPTLPGLLIGLLLAAAPVSPAKAAWWPADVDKALARAGDNRAELVKALTKVPADQRKAMAFLDAFVLNKPEIFIGGCASKFDEKTGELKDEATRGFIKQQLAAFATYIVRVAPKA